MRAPQQRESSESRFFPSLPNRPRYSSAVLFIPFLFSDAPRRLLIRQRIEGTRWHAGGGGNGKASGVIFDFSLAIACRTVNHRCTRDPPKFIRGLRDRYRYIGLISAEGKRRAEAAKSDSRGSRTESVSRAEWRISVPVYCAWLMRFPIQKAQRGGGGDPKQPRFDIRLLQVSVGPLHPRLN